METTPGIGANRGSDRHDGGFTLIESLTASAILLVIAIGVITTLVSTGSWYAKARLRTEANAVANQVMSVILSRNYADIHYAEAGQSWPTGIPLSMSWDSSYGDFTVETSMSPTVDPATGLDMKKIVVTAIPVGQELEPAVAVVRYASGWQQMSSNVAEFLVPVRVQLTGLDGSVSKKGVRVQLRDVNTMAEVRWALSDDSGVATFKNVVEGQYYLTADPRYGTNVRPVHFPTRIFPTHGGSANNPIMSVNTHNPEMSLAETGGVLAVGAYRGAGFRSPVINPDGTSYSWTWPEAPYKPAEGVVVYARPVLNTGSGSGIVGSGTRYPDEQKIFEQGLASGYYSATVNAYGVAIIPIQWTTEPAEGQTWQVWYTLRGADGSPVRVTRTSKASGSWTTEITKPDLTGQADHVYGDVPQWENLVNIDPLNVP